VWRSRRNPHHPTAETHLTVESRPAQISRVPAAGVAREDTPRVVFDSDEPVTLAEPAGAIHQQRTLIQPALEFGDRAQRTLVGCTGTQATARERASESRSPRVEQSQFRRDTASRPDQSDGVVDAAEWLPVRPSSQSRAAAEQSALRQICQL